MLQKSIWTWLGWFNKIYTYIRYLINTCLYMGDTSLNEYQNLHETGTNSQTSPCSNRQDYVRTKSCLQAVEWTERYAYYIIFHLNFIFSGIFAVTPESQNLDSLLLIPFVKTELIQVLWLWSQVPSVGKSSFKPEIQERERTASMYPDTKI